MKRKVIVWMLAFCLLIGCVSLEAHAAQNTSAQSGRSSLEGTYTKNISGNSYFRWDSVRISYLNEREDGNLERIQCVIGTGIVISQFDKNMELVKETVIEQELNGFGGFFGGKDNNYILYGELNREESDDAEVLRIVKYSKDWERLGSCSVYGANTTVPFRAGTSDMAEAGGKLYIHTCHEMYASDDGWNHQANMTFVLDQETMTVTDSWYDVMNLSYGYCSHSFSQRVRTTDQYVFRVDHGDAYPRAICITRADVDGEITDVLYNDLIEIPGEVGDNSTGVSMGGFELSSGNCLVVGNSVDLSDPENYDTDGVRNIFLCVGDQELKGSDTIWLTDYTAEDGVDTRTPQIVKVADDRFLILWETVDRTDIYYYNYDAYARTWMVLVDGSGKKLCEPLATDARLSDCQPIVTQDGCVTWFTATDDDCTLYRVNWNQLLTSRETVEDALGHQFERVNAVDATCITEGYTGDLICVNCGEVQETGTVIPVTDHQTELINEKAATCTEAGYSGDKVCTFCGMFVEIGKVIPAAGHRYENVVTNPTCTEKGCITYTCTVCGDCYKTEIEATGHSYGDWVLTKEPAYSQSGEETCTCANCGDTQSRTVPAKGVPFTDIDASEYYYDPVLWAVDRGITTGTTETTFSPAQTCTRAQVVTFLWRSAGEPQPTTAQNPFTDVPSGEYFYNAVLWAVENGITTGTSSTEFSPNAGCTRGQVAAFLWRANGKPEPQNASNPFSDVASGEYYCPAILWAVENGVTNGVGGGKFAPNAVCTRAQIVTFLYRASV